MKKHNQHGSVDCTKSRIKWLEHENMPLSVAEDSMELYLHEPLPIHLYSAVLRHRQFFLTIYCKEILDHLKSGSSLFSFLDGI
jgi:hypothetical protein